MIIISQDGRELVPMEICAISVRYSGNALEDYYIMATGAGIDPTILGVYTDASEAKETLDSIARAYAEGAAFTRMPQCGWQYPRKKEV